VVPRRTDGTGLAPQGRGALGEKIRGELRGDGVFGIPPRVDAEGAEEGCERRDRLRARANGTAGIGGGFAMRENLFFQEIVVFVGRLGRVPSTSVVRAAIPPVVAANAPS